MGTLDTSSRELMTDLDAFRIAGNGKRPEQFAGADM